MRINGVNTNFNNLKINNQSLGMKENSKTQNPINGYPQIVDLKSLPLSCHNISFTRRMKEHESWGAVVDPETKDVSFKIFTYPDVKRVDVKIFDDPKGEEFHIYNLRNNGHGVFKTVKSLKPHQAKPGDRYSFVITKKDGTIDEVKDPYAYRQGNQNSDDFLKYSIIYDHSAYEWKNDEIWKNSSERIVRNPSASGNQKGVREASIYEMHIDSCTKEGTFEAAKRKVPDIKESGFNAAEIMPNENTYSYNWGYDGVDKFAVPEHRGGPDDLKEYVDYLHGQGLNAIMDLVPNHLGPDGAQLKRTGPYIKGENIFGESFNFEGENSRYVRDYIVNTAINWIKNYHVDGLRLDMTKFMESDFTMKEIATEINYHFPDVFLIAEDSRQHINANEYDYWEDYNELHDKRVVYPLTDDETCVKKSERKHCEYINSIDKAINTFVKEDKTHDAMLRNLGYDSEWDFSFHHSLNNAIYTGKNLEWLMESIYQSQKNVKYVASHDEIGNMDGTRPVVKYLVPKLDLNSNVLSNEEDIKRIEEYAQLKEVSLFDAKNVVMPQKAQQVGEVLAKLYAQGNLRQYKHQSNMKFYIDILKPLDIKPNSNITYRKLETAFRKSAAQHRMAQALTFAIPGPKMVFQGDENLDITPFRFFRQFENPPVESYLDIEKGYPSGKAALEASTFGNIEYSKKETELMQQFNQLTKDLNKLNRENPALTKGYLTLKEDGSKNCIIQDGIVAINPKDEKTGNEFFIITNFNDNAYPSGKNGELNIHFPKGKWVEVLNTNDTKYGGTGKCLNKDYIEGFGIDDNKEHKASVKLKEMSTVYFKKIA